MNVLTKDALLRMLATSCRTLGMVILLLATASAGASAGEAAQLPRAAVASAHPQASAAGMEIIASGGNAFDAAIAVSTTLAVVEPYSSGVGGGGFWLLHRESDGHQIMIDGREKAPAAATRDMYLDADGNVVRDSSLNGPLAAGIPGLMAGVEHLATHYGRLPLAASLAPAIRLAREGFSAGKRYSMLAGYRHRALQADAGAAAIFLQAGEVPQEGFVIRQPDLAVTLQAVADRGASAFYTGDIAKRLVDGVRSAGGIWTLQDLEDYAIVERQPIIGRYRDLRVVTVPPPSSGGVVLMQALNILEGFELAKLASATRRHVIIEAMRRAYRDRAEFLGDSDFVEVPIAALTDKGYAAEQRTSIQLAQATPSDTLPGLVGEEPEKGRDTTHFSVIDQAGNRVGGTLSINIPFGAAFVPAGTGVLLNDEMDDFSARPLTPNAYGLVGLHANAIAPGKRPLSSMTPTFVEADGRVAILGTPGGSRIISMVLLGVLDFASGEPAESWVSVKRFHHQYLPDHVQFEIGAFSEAEQRDLRGRGHTLREMSRSYGNMHAILWDRTNGTVTAASDPRGEGGVAYYPQ